MLAAQDEPAPATPVSPEPPPAAEPARDGGGTATATRPTPRTAPPRLEKLPPFKVLLHNDDVNDVQFVVRSIVELTPLKLERAVQATIEAHTSGVSLLVTTHKELAELYRDQFTSKGLTVTIEPA